MKIKRPKQTAPGAFKLGKEVAIFVDGRKFATLSYSQFIKEYRRLKDLQGIKFQTIE